MNIGQRVKEARKHRNVTQQELATGVGVTQTTITNLESGRNSGSKHALKIAQFLNINPAWLENGTGPMEVAVREQPAQCTTNGQESIMQRVEKRLKEMGEPLAWFGEKLDASPQTVNNWKKRGLPARNLSKAAAVLGVTREYLEFGSGPRSAAEPTADYAKVIQLEDATHWQAVAAIQYLPTPPGEFTGFYVIAPDDLMLNLSATCIAKGAFVAFNTQRTEPVDEKIYLVASEDRPEPIIRKLVKIAGQWHLLPENPSFQGRFTEPLRESDQLLGRLTGIANYVE